MKKYVFLVFLTFFLVGCSQTKIDNTYFVKKGNIEVSYKPNQNILKIKRVESINSYSLYSEIKSISIAYNDYDSSPIILINDISHGIYFIDTHNGFYKYISENRLYAITELIKLRNTYIGISQGKGGLYISITNQNQSMSSHYPFLDHRSLKWMISNNVLSLIINEDPIYKEDIFDGIVFLRYHWEYFIKYKNGSFINQ